MIRALGAALAVVFLTGCSMFIERGVNDALTETVETAEKILASAPDHSLEGGVVKHYPGYWFGDRVLRTRRGLRLPSAIADRQVSVFVSASDPGSRSRLLQDAMAVVELPILLDPVSTSFVRDATDSPPSAADPLPSAGPLPINPYGVLDHFATGLLESPASNPYRDLADFILNDGYRTGPIARDFTFEGSASELLSRVAVVLGFSGWLYDGSSVLLYLHEQRDFSFPLLPTPGSRQVWSQTEAGIRLICGDCLVNTAPAPRAVYRPCPSDRLGAGRGVPPRAVGEAQRVLPRCHRHIRCHP